MNLATFSNLPVKCTFRDYESAIKEYIDGIQKHGSKISVYQIGNVGVAGISDIDIIVFIDDEYSGDFTVYPHLTGTSKYLFMHDVYPVPKSYAVDINILTSIFDLDYLHGERLSLKNPSYTSLESIMYLNDLAVVSLSHEYENLIFTWRNNIRLTIARINSLKYPIALIEQLVNVDDNYASLAAALSIPKEYVKNFSDYRNHYFDIPSEEAMRLLNDYVTQAREIARILLRILDQLNSTQTYFTHSLESFSFSYYGTKISSEEHDCSLA